MGGIISRFRGKQTTIEILEGIDKEISRLQKNRRVNQDRQKRFVTSLLIYSIAVYVIAAIIFFCLYFPDTWLLRFLYSIPLLIFPFLVWGVKKLLHWYFVKRIASNDLALQELRERKKQILEDVMETETYKKAREILEKFDPTRLHKLEGNNELPSTSNTSVHATPGTVIHHRTMRTVHQTSRMPGPSTPQLLPAVTSVPSTPAAALQPQPGAPSQLRPTFSNQAMIRGSMVPSYATGPPGPPMPRSVLPKERGTMDRLMDYLVGDGPENRYALICRQCHSHNGMALKEEFEHLTFRCCYCYTINPARKQRPMAPKLEFFAPLGRLQGAQQPGSGSKESDEEEEDDDDVDDDDDEEGSESDVDSQNVSPGSSTLTKPGIVKSFNQSAAATSGSSVGMDKSQSLFQKSSAQSVKAAPVPTLSASPSSRPSDQPPDLKSKTSAADVKQSPVMSVYKPGDKPSEVLRPKAPSVDVKQGQAMGQQKSADKSAELVKSAEGLRDNPEFDKTDFFSVSGSIVQPVGDGLAHNGLDSNNEVTSNTTQNDANTSNSISSQIDAKVDKGQSVGSSSSKADISASGSQTGASLTDKAPTSEQTSLASTREDITLSVKSKVSQQCSQ